MTQALFHGPNAGLITELLETLDTNPQSLDAETRTLLQTLRPYASAPTTYNNGHIATNGTSVAPVQMATNEAVVGAVNLASAIREFGHLAAQLDPLGTKPKGDPALASSFYGIDETTLASLPSSIVSGPWSSAGSAADAIAGLRRVYSQSIGFEFGHVVDPEERTWFREAAETRRFHPSNDPIDNEKLLHRLTQVEGFEQFLHTTFQGKKRFSIEGLDAMVPLLDEVIDRAGDHEIRHIVMGMAHRGRLNVLTHVLQKPYNEMLEEFKDVIKDEGVANFTGDVKYHAGAKRIVQGKNCEMIVEIADNPSHLELVNPVVEGMTRAAGETANDSGEVNFDKQSVMAILVHGDAAFAGQGIVAETFNFSQVPGWRTGGTLHIIANNQVGFTTNKTDARSTLYSSDLAKGYRVPIMHVNADDIEAVIEVARIAFAYQEKFEKDVLIDLVGYRRYGHNEGDEPRFTQPMMYKRVDGNPTVRAKWANTLIQRGLITAETADQMVKTHFDEMQAIYESLNYDPPQPQRYEPDKHVRRDIDTAIDAETLTQINTDLLDFPPNFEIHKGLKRVFNRRKKAFEGGMDTAEIDWGQAEALAFATILADGIPIRLTGEDVERGTFSHRHAVLRDQNTGAIHIPHQKIPQANAGFTTRNSVLSENAAVGFEYGYSLQARERLVLWEAQFGDFVNGAQPVIDEFITSGKAKWGHLNSLVMLLPHGYEGQGPDHSTARLERFLSMAADLNMRIVYPTTAAQYFHLLRRQVALSKTNPRPLIVMSPKSLLRHPMARSSIRNLAEGSWQRLINDATIDGRRRKSIKRIAVCSGKVYVDAMTSDQRPDKPKVALVRAEQLYRFPLDELKELIATYKGATELVWFQEEPRNGGAWNYVRPLFDMAVEGTDLTVKYIGRPHRASPAEGSLTWHKINQENIIKELYTV